MPVMAQDGIVTCLCSFAMRMTWWLCATVSRLMLTNATIMHTLCNGSQSAHRIKHWGICHVLTTCRCPKPAREPCRRPSNTLPVALRFVKLWFDLFGSVNSVRSRLARCGDQISDAQSSSITRRIRVVGSSYSGGILSPAKVLGSSSTSCELRLARVAEDSNSASAASVRDGVGEGTAQR